MTNYIIFFLLQLIFIIFQYFTYTKLPLFQYCELFFGSLFIILFFGLLAAMLMLSKDFIDKSIYASIFFMLYYYLTKKMTNSINSDINGVIDYT